jgi:hypothetical protein
VSFNFVVIFCKVECALSVEKTNTNSKLKKILFVVVAVVVVDKIKIVFRFLLGVLLRKKVYKKRGDNSAWFP